METHLTEVEIHSNFMEKQFLWKENYFFLSKIEHHYDLSRVL